MIGPIDDLRNSLSLKGPRTSKHSNLKTKSISDKNRMKDIEEDLRDNFETNAKVVKKISSKSKSSYHLKQRKRSKSKRSARGGIIA